MEIIIELIVEILLLTVGEALINLTMRTLSNLFGGIFWPETVEGKTHYKVHPIAALIGYFCIGALAGWISLLLIPEALITSHTGRIANLIVMPLAGGAFMELWGRLLKKKEMKTMRLDSFMYGAFLSLGSVLLRFFFAI
jgi:hypothetical protein